MVTATVCIAPWTLELQACSPGRCCCRGPDVRGRCVRRRCIQPQPWQLRCGRRGLLGDWLSQLHLGASAPAARGCASWRQLPLDGLHATGGSLPACTSHAFVLAVSDSHRSWQLCCSWKGAPEGLAARVALQDFCSCCMHQAFSLLPSSSADLAADLISSFK